MNHLLVERIVQAVLYEGYMLYPYRPSAVKNRQRWNFGVLYPQAYSKMQTGADISEMQTQCVVHANKLAILDIHVRFLQLQAREVGELSTALLELAGNVKPDFHLVDSLEIGNQVFQPWQEAVERDVNASRISLSELLAQPRQLTFGFTATEELELLRDSEGQVKGAIVRKQQSIEGVVEISAEQTTEELFKITVRIKNMTPFGESAQWLRDEALVRSFVSTHTILSVQDGQFVSLLDPQESFRAAAASCRNVGTWPVLVGADGERGCMLSSPIILYDYPQVAPESAGDLFDSTEIDEILTLRILTLTDEEKREMRSVDERAREILERTETLPAEQLMKLHGAVRGLRPLKDGRQ
jgi:hydrogenase maturation protease